MEALTKKFSDINLSDLPQVGGKNASLGEMIGHLASKGINVPDGFATTAFCFWHFLDSNKLWESLEELMRHLDRQNFSNLKETGLKARTLIQTGVIPEEIAEAVGLAYRELCGDQDCLVAVRSSATAEDLPEASFAGQHDSFLNVKGETDVLNAVRNCFASLYTDRAIKYREDKGFAHKKVAISVGIQKMVAADNGCAGVAFTLEPESGFRNIIHIGGVWGLGENIVQGTVNPDEFLVFKPTLIQGKNAIVQKKLGDKALTMVYGMDKAKQVNIDTPEEKKRSYVLSDPEIKKLANWCLLIENHYQKPMDIEWAKDGETGNIYILQARPETVQSTKSPLRISEYKLSATGTELVQGLAVGSRIVCGTARIIQSPKDSSLLKEGEILVTDVTSPDWDPILKKAAAIITNKGGRTSHASIVARELGVPAVVGCTDATTKIHDGQRITVSCAEGKNGIVFDGEIPFRIIEHDFTAAVKPDSTEVMMILGDPDKAFRFSFFPNDGVGLLRMEFIINHSIQVHPMALVKFNELKDEEARSRISELTRMYDDKEDYFIDKLSQGIATIAAAFYPKDVIVRMSDFKTNEYANLLGGKQFEPAEENPMLGFRGASRYYHQLYRDGFRLECAAIRKAREEMGFTNIKLMIPFCRTLDEGRKVIEVLSENDLDRAKDTSLQIFVMAEIPSNVILAEEFAKIFDGFSIGSNDLTQLTLGIDRDSAIVSNLFSEQDPAAREMIRTMIRKARKLGVKVGLCGQAPSDFPVFAQFLVEEGISSISFNPDALLRGIENILIAERTTQKDELVNYEKTFASLNDL